MGCWILVLWYTTATEISESNRVALTVLASLMILVHWQGNNKQKCLLNYKFHWNHRGKVSVCQIEEDKTGMKGILCSSFSEGIRSAFLIVTERKLEWCHWTSRHCPAYAHTHTVTTYGSTSSKCIKLLQHLRRFWKSFFFHPSSPHAKYIIRYLVCLPCRPTWPKWGTLVSVRKSIQVWNEFLKH